MSGIIRVYQGLQIGQNFSDDSTEVTIYGENREIKYPEG